MNRVVYPALFAVGFLILCAICKKMKKDGATATPAGMAMPATTAMPVRAGNQAAMPMATATAMPMATATAMPVQVTALPMATATAMPV